MPHRSAARISLHSSVNDASWSTASLAELSGRIAEAAVQTAEDAFPAEAFAVLAREGWLQAPMVAGTHDSGSLLRLLAATGRGDLSVGRIFEGHVNALDLVFRFGSSAQRASATRDVAAGSPFAVWNTDQQGRSLRMRREADEIILEGAKSFASGVDGVTRAVVTATALDGKRVMLLVPLTPGDETVDRSWWRPIGMKASVSHVIDLTGRRLSPDDVIGHPGDYVRQPWFSAGAVRFAAVQVGGMHALLDAVRAHLVGTGRSDDAYQQHRLGQLAVAVETGYAWLARTAAHWDAGCQVLDAGKAAQDAAVAHANLTRCAVEEACMRALSLAQRAVGAAGLIAPHPLERRVRDLMVYLRQPNPDRALAEAGAAVAAGVLDHGS